MENLYQPNFIKIRVNEIINELIEFKNNSVKIKNKYSNTIFFKEKQ